MAGSHCISRLIIRSFFQSGVHYDSDRTVVDKLYLHIGAKNSARCLTASQFRHAAAIRFIEWHGEVMSGRTYIAGTIAFTRGRS